MTSVLSNLGDFLKEKLEVIYLFILIVKKQTKLKFF